MVDVVWVQADRDAELAHIAEEVGALREAEFKWRHGMEQVAWERLKDAVDFKGVTWEWLIEGR